MKKYFVGFMVFVGVLFMLNLATSQNMLFHANDYWNSDDGFSASNRVQSFGTSNTFRAAYDTAYYADLSADSSGNLVIDSISGAIKHQYDAAAYWTATQADGGAVTFNSVSGRKR